MTQKRKRKIPTDPAKQKRWHQGGWHTKEEALDAFRNLRNDVLAGGLRAGEPIPQERFPVHVAWLVWLIQGHPFFAEKARGGIYGFSLHDNGHKVFGFSVIDGFGVHNQFSMLTALNGKPGSKDQMATLAFRCEISEQMIEAKRRALGSRCPETGVVLTEDNCEIDHATVGGGLSFSDLVKWFLEQMGLKLSRVHAEYNRYLPAGSQRPFLLDRLLALQWTTFHRAHAKLEAVSREGHNRRTANRRSQFYGIRS